MATLTIKTGLTGKKNFEILQSVLGQLSDGMWENSPGMEKYWRFANVELKGDDVILLIEDDAKPNYNYTRHLFSGFAGKSEQQIKDFFATKLKQVIKQEIEDYGNMAWDRNDKTVSKYLGYDEDITVQDAYKAYEVLKGRSVGSKYETTQASAVTGAGDEYVVISYLKGKQFDYYKFPNEEEANKFVEREENLNEVGGLFEFEYEIQSIPSMKKYQR